MTKFDVTITYTVHQVITVAVDASDAAAAAQQVRACIQACHQDPDAVAHAYHEEWQWHADAYELNDVSEA